MLHVPYDVGQKIHVGDVLVVIGDAGEAWHTESTTVASPTAASVSVVGTLDVPTTHLPPSSEFTPLQVSPTSTSPSRRILAIPSVRKLARDLGIDLAQVTATGPHGRIRREDVLQASQQRSAPAVTASMRTPATLVTEQDQYGPIALQPLSALRRTIAAAMVAAATTAVPVTTTDEADVTELVALRERSKEAAAAQQVSLTLLPFIMKAVVAALHQYPSLNATLDAAQERLIVKYYYHLGIATDTPEGLLVPVVKDVDKKNLLTLAADIQRLTDLASSRRVSLQDLRGSTFTISNYGAIGGIFATPMLHLPEVAILGVGKLLQKPVVYQGNIAIRTLLPLSLTFDHRALDGATAQHFLNTVLQYLSDPARLVLVI